MTLGPIQRIFKHRFKGPHHQPKFQVKGGKEREQKIVAEIGFSSNTALPNHYCVFIYTHTLFTTSLSLLHVKLHYPPRLVGWSVIFLLPKHSSCGSESPRFISHFYFFGFLFLLNIQLTFCLFSLRFPLFPKKNPFFRLTKHLLFSHNFCYNQSLTPSLSDFVF